MPNLVSRRPRSHKAFFDLVSKIASLFARMQIENSQEAITQSLKLGDHSQSLFKYDFVENFPCRRIIDNSSSEMVKPI